MIITKTPFRMSFAGGGTDLKAFYSLEHGAVLSTAIDKYMYITVNKRFDRTIRLSYSKTEIVDDVESLQHDIVREALKRIGIREGLEITSIADLPAGSGMGSSSSFTVGLMHALYAHRGIYRTSAQLAEDACTIEIDVLGAPIGKQDQYAAAFGGLNVITFHADGKVFVEPIICRSTTLATLNDRLLLFFTGETRDAHDILCNLQTATESRMKHLLRMRELVDELKKILVEGRDLRSFGEVLGKGWKHKREIADGISNSAIDETYDRALKAGAVGGKILGAGGGGFLLLYVELEDQANVIQALSDLRRLPFRFEQRGSHVIYMEV